MRKEARIGILLITIINVVNLITDEIGTETPVLHFLLGGLVGLALIEITMGLLPESVYSKIKNYKRKYNA